MTEESFVVRPAASEWFVVRPAARKSEGRRIFASLLGGVIFAAAVPNRAVPMSSLRLAPAPRMPDRLAAGPRGTAVGCGRPKTFALANVDLMAWKEFSFMRAARGRNHATDKNEGSDQTRPYSVLMQL